jgi:hypothetical protein
MTMPRPHGGILNVSDQLLKRLCAAWRTNEKGNRTSIAPCDYDGTAGVCGGCERLRPILTAELAEIKNLATALLDADKEVQRLKKFIKSIQGPG